MDTCNHGREKRQLREDPPSADECGCCGWKSAPGSARCQKCQPHPMDDAIDHAADWLLATFKEAPPETHRDVLVQYMRSICNEALKKGAVELQKFAERLTVRT